MDDDAKSPRDALEDWELNRAAVILFDKIIGKSCKVCGDQHGRLETVQENGEVVRPRVVLLPYSESGSSAVDGSIPALMHTCTGCGDISLFNLTFLLNKGKELGGEE